MTRTSVLQVREKTAEDRPWLAQRLKQNWGSEQIVTRGIIHEAADLPGFVAERGGKVVGVALYALSGVECEIVLLESFAPQTGVGTTLVGALKEKMLFCGCRRLWVITTNDNTAALRFYQKRGFVFTALHKNALEYSRKLKPQIPEVGIDGIPLRDELELEYSFALHEQVRHGGTRDG